MQKFHEFAPADRYLYDFRHCTTAGGWAQFDTRDDASYFGNWLNPFKLEFFSYCEGDTTLIRCDDAAEFVEHVRSTVAWYSANSKFLGIDPGFNEELKAEFVKLGLDDLLH